MMRILVCALEAPLPPMNGLRLQVTPVCEQLAARGHEVCVLAYMREGQHGNPPPGVELRTIDDPRRRRFRASLGWVLSSRPLAPIVAHRPMAEAAQALVRRRDFDVVHVVGFPLAELGRDLDPLPSVLTVFDANYLNFSARRDAANSLLTPLFAAEVRRVARFERRAYQGHRAVVAVTAQDASALRELDPELPIAVVPNGVDTDHFRPNPSTPREPGLVVLTGAMHWAPNVASARFLVEAVLPRLRERRPDARVAIVGRAPSADVLKLARHANVAVTGEVPEVRDWLARASAYACPMIDGTGIKNKLLEAMACGCSCVVTSLACYGLEVADGVELLIRDEPDAFAEALARLLDAPATADQLGSAARQYTLDHHAWSAAADAYERLLEDAARDRDSNGATVKSR